MSKLNQTRTFKETGNSIPIRVNGTSTKQVKVTFGKVTESIVTRKVREKNERIIEWYQFIKNEPFHG
ncbi:hypothetical protein [Lederbergia panacisoli]|uniref:hypothetical protein n=1 Tax=Lederbergia panacisoli TaxID=1255251 RepID=UPI00214BCD25|nr:hypothetical protein [Lederbergia panacisoli]MCR2822745.1 hypothetical protein [Lederbergia panacisoli]